MKPATNELFKTQNVETIVNTIETELKTRNESPFWADKVVPFSRAILSILVPLREQNLLFTPEGTKTEELTPKLFLEWMDFMSLKGLAFTIQKSNAADTLLRTSIGEDECAKYEVIDLSYLGDYLAKYSVNLTDENLDFPISNYNLHQGVKNVINTLL